MRYSLIYAPLFLLFSCGAREVVEESSNESQNELSISDSLINETIKAHGGELYNDASFQFTFREKVYSFKNNGAQYEYTSEFQTDNGWQKDVFKDREFTRSIEGNELNLSEEDAEKYGESLNSVIYFATLPHKLSDASVQSEYLGQKTIGLNLYETVKVMFKQEGGGQDFQDEYCYWINTENNRVDYFAYNYQVNGGGVRFRSAFNTREVEGVLFQDYINFEAEVGTPLVDLPGLFELDSLKELSRIELTGIKVLD